MKKYAILLSTTVLCLLCFLLLRNYSDRFEEISYACETGMSVPLVKEIDSAAIADVLRRNMDGADADFVAGQIQGKLDKGVKLRSLSDLNKRIWQLSSTVIDSSGSPKFKERLKRSREILGQDGEFSQAGDTIRSEVFLNNGTGRIRVRIYERDDASGRFHKKETACSDVLVRLSEHYKDSLIPTRRTLAWARTNEDGIVVFSGLDAMKSYSVLPVENGYGFGGAKGTTMGSLAGAGKKQSATYSFERQEHKVRMFDTGTLSRIKEDHMLIVRTPGMYKRSLILWLVFFGVTWYGFALLWSRKQKTPDYSIIAILMFLTGVCILCMFSINDPMEDVLLGADMAQGVVMGVLVMGLLQFIDFTKLYQNRLKIGFDIPVELASRIGKSLGLRMEKEVRLPKGLGYLLTGLLLTALLWTPFGNEVGGMRVNLNLFGIKFQPSEIVKYLIVTFMATFFCRNADKIVKYSAKGNVNLLGQKLKMLGIMIVGLGLLMVMYLMLGDMGPALVMAFTFILLYSLVKSKVDLENLDERHQNIKIMSCDLAMLIYGVLSFIVLLYIGWNIGRMGLFCLGWFFLWILFGLLKKRLFESAIMFNLIIAVFLFGGNLLKSFPNSRLNDIGERLEERNRMSSNTWGMLPIVGPEDVPGDNTQVAEGLWALASGGFWGQGPGNGSPAFIPAFHTDMVLGSIGEQLGFAGLFVLILLLAVLLRKTVLVGYRASHPFGFYLCTGIAIVTGVQFIIIALGSTGVIPLTGVTVPFLSYGKVSMILNLAAFGIVLSYARILHCNHVRDRSGLGSYNYPVSILSWCYCGLTIFICGVLFHCQIADRDGILVRPVYVHNAEGLPIINYNPRINQLTDKMWAGDLYDRNGLLLATSDKSKFEDDRFKLTYKRLGLYCDTTKTERRYYPFGAHLAFMIGHPGSDVVAFRNERAGYAAEFRHLSELRGFDNKMYTEHDGLKVPLKVTLVSDHYKPGRFFSKESVTLRDVQLRDYSALLPYLKAGFNGDHLKWINTREATFPNVGKIEPQDVSLTIDAELQTRLQQEISRYVDQNPLLRISVVILDARDGDLLSSAVFPLPDEERLRAAQQDDVRFYQDVNRPDSWNAYADMDLGLCFYSPPGSTGKVMSAMAGLRNLGAVRAKHQTYQYLAGEKTGMDPSHLIGRNVTMDDAITWSSNNYFIKLVNDKNLYENLAFIYSRTGARVNFKQTYGLTYPAVLDTADLYLQIRQESKNAVQKFRSYMADRKEKGVDWVHPLRDDPAWMWAYGQGTLDATPMTMARVAATVVNGGRMPMTRYVLDTPDAASVEILGYDEATLLKAYMQHEALAHSGFSVSRHIGGKTGTPERVFTETNRNDGWYVCFIEDASVSSRRPGERLTRRKKVPLALAVRMERLHNGQRSGEAVRLVKQAILPVLENLGYIAEN